jgi:hypothetical protein
MTNTIDIPQTSNQWLSMKEASEITGKSVHTIKKLVQKDKVKNKKVKGKYGDETRILASDLEDYYKEEIKGQTKHEPKADKPQTNTSDNTQDNGQTTVTGNDSTTVKVYIELVESLKSQNGELLKELENKNAQIEKLQTIITNQQSLSLQQNQNYTKMLEDSEEKNERKKLFGLF